LGCKRILKLDVWHFRLSFPEPRPLTPANTTHHKAVFRASKNNRSESRFIYGITALVCAAGKVSPLSAIKRRSARRQTVRAMWSLADAGFAPGTANDVKGGKEDSNSSIRLLRRVSSRPSSGTGIPARMPITRKRSFCMPVIMPEI